MTSQKIWSDGKTYYLEQKLNKVMIGLIYAAAWEQERRAQRIIWKKKREIKNKKWKEKEKLKRINEFRVSNLESGFEKWQKYIQMSDYVSAVKPKYTHQDSEYDEDFNNWMEWSDEYLSKMNPLNGEKPKYDIVDPFPWFRN